MHESLHTGTFHRHKQSIGIPVQVREALRRSRVESRDLRASLFRAEAVIKQLTLTKAARRRGAHNSNAAQRDASSPPLSSAAAVLSAAAAAAAVGGEKERRLVSYLLASGSSGGSGNGSGADERGGERGGKGGGTMSSSRTGSSSDNGNNTCPVGSSTTTTNAESDSSKTTMPSQEILLKRVHQLEREPRLADFRNVNGADGHGRRTSVEEVRLFRFRGGFPSHSTVRGAHHKTHAPLCWTTVENPAL